MKRQTVKLQTAGESLKERARQARREAYRAAKARRAADPRHAEMKERAKQRRREQYQRAKELRKAALLTRSVTRSATKDAAEAGQGMEGSAQPRTVQRTPRAGSAEAQRLERQLQEQLHRSRAAASLAAAPELAAEASVTDNLAESGSSANSLAADNLAESGSSADSLAANSLAANSLAANSLAANSLAANDVC